MTSSIKYPETRREDLVETYHGTQVADPYRWLEDPDSEEAKAWIAAQNQVTDAFLAAIPARETIQTRLEALWNFERYGEPVKFGGRYFFTKQDGLQNQSVLYVADTLDADARVLLDPNALSADGTVAMSGWSVSEDGKYLAYGLQAAGSDWEDWRVRSVDTGQDLSDHLKWIKFSGTAWTHDGKGFYYSRYPEPKAGQSLTEANLSQKLYYHRLGDDQSKDTLIYEEPSEPTWGYSARVSDDGRYLIVSVWKGTGPKNLVLYQDLGQPPATAQAGKAGKAAGTKPAKAAPRAKDPKAAPVTKLIAEFTAQFSFIDNQGEVLWFHTDLDAPRGRVIAIDTRKPERDSWQEIIPESKHALSAVHSVGGKLIAEYLEDAHSVVKVFEPSGAHVRDLDVPGLGTVTGFGGRKDDPETFYGFTSFTTPGTVYRYDVATGKSRIWRQPEIDFQSARYVTEQVFYTSKDGTRVPMFLVYRRGLERNGANPTILYGYGGFNYALTPTFAASRAVWLEMGGIFALANLRGGGEYGEEWHQAGTKLRKQNVFDDFIAAAEWLIGNQYTKPSKLAILGASNGGLLVGAAMIQRPTLFGAAIPQVGVMDMLRFHKFTIGWAWVDDYGSPDNAEEFAALYRYSPYHNLKPGTAYPATLVLTGDHDDRVVPGHSFKFAAALQHAHRGIAPVLIRIETRAGHGGGKPTSMIISEYTDIFTFLAKVLEMGKVSLGDDKANEDE